MSTYCPRHVWRTWVGIPHLASCPANILKGMLWKIWLDIWPRYPKHPRLHGKEIKRFHSQTDGLQWPESAEQRFLDIFCQICSVPKSCSVLHFLSGFTLHGCHNQMPGVNVCYVTSMDPKVATVFSVSPRFTCFLRCDVHIHSMAQPFPVSPAFPVGMRKSSFAIFLGIRPLKFSILCPIMSLSSRRLRKYHDRVMNFLFQWSQI